MSYILEALKKAQAERQLGALPTIYAPTLQSAAAAAPVRARWPWLLALGLTTAGVAGLLLLRQSNPRQSALAPASLPAPVLAPPSAPAPLGAAMAPAAATALAAAAPAPSMAATPAIAPVAAAVNSPAAAIAPAAAPAHVPVAQVAPPAAPVAPAARAIAQEAARPAVAAPQPARAEPPAQDEAIQTLQELPEPIQRAIPALALGGYIYSKNPADRLLLVDKVLRHEGDELAPGLVLEKLLPRAAVFSFKGYRYRVPY